MRNNIPDIGLNLEKLKSLREANGLTLERVSKALKYKTVMGYFYVEQGTRGLSAVRAARLAFMYGVSMEQLFVYS